MFGIRASAAVVRTTAAAAARHKAFMRRRGQFGNRKGHGAGIARLLGTGELARAQYGLGIMGIADHPLMQKTAMRRKNGWKFGQRKGPERSTHRRVRGGGLRG